MARLSRRVTEANRSELVRAVAGACVGSRFQLDDPKRTNEQNRLMWVLLNRISAEVMHAGMKHSPQVWKAIFMHGLGRQMDFAPGLDGEIVGLGYRSSELSKEEMSDLIEFIRAENAQRWGVNLDAP